MKINPKPLLIILLLSIFLNLALIRALQIEIDANPKEERIILTQEEIDSTWHGRLKADKYIKFDSIILGILLIIFSVIKITQRD